MDNKKQKNNKIIKKKDSIIYNKMIKYQEESSILGNTFYFGYLVFAFLLIIFSIIYYLIKISNPFWMGISAFFISIITTILYYICQKRKQCKIRMIVDLKNY
jgi:predicted PurR-regulated permease PerM